MQISASQRLWRQSFQLISAGHSVLVAASTLFLPTFWSDRTLISTRKVLSISLVIDRLRVTFCACSLPNLDGQFADIKSTTTTDIDFADSLHKHYNLPNLKGCNFVCIAICLVSSP